MPALTAEADTSSIAGTARQCDRAIGRAVGAGVLAVMLIAALAYAGDIPRDVRIVLAVLGLAMIGWMLTPISDAAIAAAAVIALTLAGILKPRDILHSVTHELVWLLLGSLVLAGVLAASGLVERSFWSICRHVGSLRQLAFALTGAISVTAFLIPSTTARAAMLVPVFLTLAGQVHDQRAVRGFALLFPTVILLSASGSLTGAAAHLIAVEYIFQTTGERLSLLDWMLLMLPFALLSSVLAAVIVILRYIPRCAFKPQVAPCAPQWTRDQLHIAAIIGCTVLLLATYPAHGWSPALIMQAAAACALLARTAPISAKSLIKRSDVQLVALVALTLALAKAVTASGAGAWLAVQALQAVPQSWMTPALIIVLVAAISLVSHLVMGSRTARAAVILSAVALPLAGMGHDPKALILIAILGTGFCQTHAASAKPLAIFASAGPVTYRSTDLLWLSVTLLPLMFALLMVFAFTVAI